jgi:tetratricopeptide (TPR) repeat protein
MFRRLCLAATTGLLIGQLACAPAGYKKTETDAVSAQATTLAMATQTWQRTSASALPAVEDLVKQADAQIVSRNFDVASEKLERALRISPDYAPAWSRIAHIALNEADPSRAIQMAKRSNSHAANAVELKLLNWQYIRKASQMLGDTDGVLTADKSINILQSL